VSSSMTSVKFPLSDSRPTLMIPTRRKPADEAAAVATTSSAGAVAKLSTKSSVRARLGEPVTSNGQTSLMISTKRKHVDETVSTMVADATQPKMVKLNARSSIKSRLGEPVVSESQQRIMISTKRKPATAAGGEQFGYVTVARNKTVFGRLGPSRI